MFRFIILFLILNNGLLFSRNPNIVKSVKDNPHYDICFSDYLHGAAIGGRGTYMFTTDGGNNWNTQYSGTDVSLNNVGLTPDGGILITGMNGTLIYYNKPGEKFEDRSIEPVHELTKFIFTDSLNGFLLTRKNYLLKTTDGGKSWEDNHFFDRFPNLVSVTGSGNKVFLAVNKKDSAAIYLTEDGGKNWKLINIFKGENLYKISLINNILWASGAGGMFCSSTNGGKSWNWYNTGLQHNVSDFIIDGKTIWLYCRWDKDRIILKSNNNGKSWEEFDKSDIGWYGKMQLVSDKLFVAEDYNGTIKWFRNE